MRRALFAAALLAALSSAALAGSPMETSQLVDSNGRAVGTPDSPLSTACVSGCSSGGGSTGSVTAAGTNGAVAQAVQGITGGIAQNSYPAQYNSTLPTLASGATGYLAADINGRLILGPSSTVTANLGTLNGAATAAGQAAQQGSVAPGTAATNSVLGGCVYTAAGITLANGQQAACQLDAAGNIKVTGGTGSGVADSVVATGAPFTLAATGPQPSFTTAGAGSVTIELTGTFTLSLSVETSNDPASTPDASATWTTITGIIPNDPAANLPTATMNSGSRKKTFPASAGTRFRLNVTSYTSGTATANAVLRTQPFAERAVAIGNTPTVNVNSTTSTNTMATSRVSLVGTGATAVQVGPTGKTFITIKNTDTTNTAYIGDGSVTSAVGFPLKPGESITLDAKNYAGTFYGICASGQTATLALLVF